MSLEDELKKAMQRLTGLEPKNREELNARVAEFGKNARPTLREEVTDAMLDLWRSADEQDWKRFFALKRNLSPGRLYKYRQPNEQALENLRSQTVWMAPASTFNDPYDSALSFDHGPTLSSEFLGRLAPHLPPVIAAQSKGPLQGLDALRDVLSRDESLTDQQRENDLTALTDIIATVGLEQVAKIRSAFQNELKICCFASDGLSPVMWAHYADSHRGFCIELPFDQLHPDHHQRVTLFPVVYHRDRFDSTDLVRNSSDAWFPPVQLIAALFKFVEWQYEGEWRLIEDTKGSRGKAVEMPKPTAVYIGARMDASYRDRLMRICTDLGLPCHEVVLSDRTFGLCPKQLAPLPL